MAVQDTLRLARQTIADLYNTASASSQPTYTLDGKTVDRTAYLESLTKQLEALNRLILSSDKLDNAERPYNIVQHMVI